MRVLMTVDPLGGVWTYALELARVLRGRGVAVALASMGGRVSGEQQREACDAGVEGLFATDLGLEWMRDRWSDVDAAGEWLLEVRDAVAPDVVHLNGYVHASLPWRAPVVVVAHSCVSSWFEAVRGTAPPPEWEGYRAAVQEGLAAADLVVAPTHAMLAALRRHYRVSTERTVVPNGRTPVEPGEKEPLVLAAGRAWDEGKNLAAVERVAERLPWDVRVAGPGSRGGAVGRRELDSLYARASIFCHPARYEPFGLAALEAAQACCALVLGDIDSLREVWSDAAVYVDPGDDDALAAALRSLIEDPRGRTELACRARARARRYTPEAMADGYLDAYERLATREREGAVA